MKELIYKTTALAVFGIFYGCYALKMLLQRRKGITTNQMGRGKTGTPLVIESLMKLATFLCPATEFFSILLLKRVPPAPLRIVGILIAVLGDAVFIVSVITMRDSWRAGVSETDRTELVTDGIYRFSRNPAFLGFDLVYLGILCMYFNWPLFAASLFAAVMFHLQIVLVEEEFLLRTFGADYQEYRKHVNRYLGRKQNNSGRRLSI